MTKMNEPYLVATSIGPQIENPDLLQVVCNIEFTGEPEELEFLKGIFARQLHARPWTPVTSVMGGMGRTP